MFWISNLPLKFDKPEAHVQHKFLAELIISRPDLFSSSPEFINKAIVIFAQILDTKLIDKEGTPLVS